MTATDRTTAHDELAEWLSSRSDEQLVELLRLRPDLSVPVPSSMAVLAARAEYRSSVLRAADDLSSLALTIVELLALEGAATEPVARRRIVELIGERASAHHVDAAFDQLRDRVLVWGDDELHLVPAAASAVPWPLGRSLDIAEPRTEAEIAAALDHVSPAERSLLEHLSSTVPIGRTRDAAPDTPADRPVQRLLSLGLLDWVDEQTVRLPHEVGQLLRGEPLSDPASLTPPELRTVKRKRDEVNAAAAGEALELIRHCEEVVMLLGDAPAPVLRAGGMGVRELRRIAKRMDLTEERVSLLVELLAGAGLLASGHPEPAPTVDDQYWAPTQAADAWIDAPTAHRWDLLARTWLQLPRRPWLIGKRDPSDKPIAALSEEVRSAAAPRDRELVLSILAELASGEAADAAEVARMVAWRRPRQAGRLGRQFVEHTFAEATAVGILGRGALSSPGRALLHGGDADAEMAAALPVPLDYVLVQADLTVVAPGPLTTDLQQRISLLADVESAGGATVYRISETSVRRGLDSGMTAADAHALFANHSRTPIPQSLTYLIDDVARRHGRLRAGVAQAFIRCDDPVLLAQVVNSAVAEPLVLRSLAPTVAISQAPLAEVLARLRDAGFAPAGEDSSGAIVNLRPNPSRIIVRRPRPQLRMPGLATMEQLENMVIELRARERAAQVNVAGVRSDGTRASAAATIAVLQLAARVQRSVRISYVDAQGTAIQRIVDPVRVGGGVLEALDPATGAMRQFTLHRIGSVSLLD
ncbi:DNA-binding protein [Skermania sp. ID1734]|uniref:helicase-associated domain-containing protein n=1 Tax=Skermania sp. ID1734 TaxID=2597516 RepID=UPI0011804DF0|nr:helicase-associated domain-containing protein [Skermania sp. ID1734]TSD96614.1 DNA-binding protein [Skermania sp. ID1734]